eukprot:CAMPEP_0172451216 /NCGR_PEP_ID=MMETSP1065-20121228/9338_1 /TAXON_ID=265537 /ORGANISM="Amphiprora paludosa, Strain CCMP125" /LENGTH=176 /DNA_ID=CAMNT_0013203145 /DNA_START=178 /DNA_END=708 /DNA_ORIENTATION=-
MSSFWTRFLAWVAIWGWTVSAFVPNPATVTSVTCRLQQSRRSTRSLRLFGVSHRDATVMMPATIEREDIKIGGPAILDRPEQRKTDDPVKERKGMGHEAWEVRIYNDGLNTREHVARSLVQVTGMTEMTAYQTMMQAHQNGIAVVGRWVYEVAEMYHDALRSNGIICDIVPVDEES